MFALSLCFQVFAEHLKSDAFFGYLTVLLKQKTISDAELKRLIENAEAGKVTNPIAEKQAKISSVHSIARSYLEPMLLSVEAKEIIPWASERLADQEWVKKRRKEVQRETERAWKNTTVGILAVGESHACVIDSNKQVVCWGDNEFGKSTPPLGLTDVKFLSAGMRHSCAVKNDGGVVCWGNDGAGQCTPPANLEKIQSLSAGYDHTCAVKDDAQVVCWGYNYAGQSKPPTDLGPVQSVFAGFKENCAIRADGGVTCWGKGECRNIPPADLLEVESLSIDICGACAAQVDGQIICWELATKPIDLGKSQPIITVGRLHACTIMADQHALCWGDNAEEQINPPSDLGEVRFIAAGKMNTCAIKFAGTVVCWGANDKGQSSPPPGLLAFEHVK